jgi:hypothetical protein
LAEAGFELTDVIALPLETYVLRASQDALRRGTTPGRHAAWFVC